MVFLGSFDINFSSFLYQEILTPLSVLPLLVLGTGMKSLCVVNITLLCHLVMGDLMLSLCFFLLYLFFFYFSLLL